MPGTLLFQEIIVPATAGRAISRRNVVYLGAFFKVTAYDLEHGDVLWVARLQTPKAGDMTPGNVSMLISGERLIAAVAGRLFALNALTGEPLRKTPVPNNPNPNQFVVMALAAGPSPAAQSVFSGVATGIERTS